MPKQERLQSATGIYHVMLRGINKQDIFEDDEDWIMWPGAGSVIIFWVYYYDGLYFAHWNETSDTITPKRAIPLREWERDGL